MKSAVATGLFKKADSSQHTPPEGFHDAGSFKTHGDGNLQLTFFGDSGAPPRFRVDADIDDAAGIGHVFQVLRNWICGDTHPYDIHQILVNDGVVSTVPPIPAGISTTGYRLGV